MKKIIFPAFFPLVALSTNAQIPQSLTIQSKAKKSLLNKAFDYAVKHESKDTSSKTIAESATNLQNEVKEDENLSNPAKDRLIELIEKAKGDPSITSLKQLKEKEQHWTQ